ncbi:hypothetical protein KC354_g12664 [Hortaea werneckii]|nr:hypothetical protein KC354_g12664 [Hortaea werneckii]
MSTTRSSSSASAESLAPYRTPETSPPFHGYDPPAIRSSFKMARNTHDEVRPENRTVIIVVKDAHDVDGAGMLFTLGLYAPFKNVFDTFKAHSCTTCRDPERIRFKADGKKLAEEDTPRKIFPSLLHTQSLSIKAFSNTPGLNCPTCKKSGYPSSSSSPAGVVVLDGHLPPVSRDDDKTKKSLRLHFQDPNGKVTAISAGFRDPLGEVMRGYARQVGSELGSLLFFFGGERVDGGDTAEEMGMKNRSVIVVHTFCIGG